MPQQVVCAIKCPSHCVYELGRTESVDLYMFEIFSAVDWKTVVEVWYNHGSCEVGVTPAKSMQSLSNNWLKKKNCSHIFRSEADVHLGAFYIFICFRLHASSKISTHWSQISLEPLYVFDLNPRRPPAPCPPSPTLILHDRTQSTVS